MQFEISTSVGCMTTRILSCMLVCMINRRHVIMSIQSSINTLELEKDELSMTMNDLKKVEQGIKPRYDYIEIYNRYCR